MKKIVLLVAFCVLGFVGNTQEPLLKTSPKAENQGVKEQKGDWLMTSHWTQDYPYNSMCPRDPVTNTASYAGCPAIAMGQIINYLGTTNGTRFDDGDDYTHSYYGRNYEIDDDWEAIGFPSFPVLNDYLDEADSIFSAGGQLTKDHEAAIVFACGTACTQVYTSSGSGTFAVEQAFDAYQRFGFDDCVLIKEPTEEMHEILRQNLRDGYPAHLAVESPDLQSGHNVVVDGYRESDGKYHMNFGYGGSIDGWYLIPDPNFYYGLTKLEGIILNIIPKAKTVADLYVSSTGYATWSVEVKQGVEFSVKLNGEEVATTDEMSYQFDTQALQDGMTYTASVAAVENNNVGEYTTISWVYASCENYNGMQEVDAWQADGDVHLDWTLPAGDILGTRICRDGEFLTFVAAGDEPHQSYIDENMGDENHEYSFRVVYDGNKVVAPSVGTYYSMSCPEIVGYTPDGILENIDKQMIVFPNPANERISVVKDGIQNLKIYNVSGQVVYEINVDSDRVEISTENLESGVYLLVINSKSGICEARIVVY